MGRRAGLGHAEAAIDVKPELVTNAVDQRRCHRRTTGIDTLEACEVGGSGIGLRCQRVESSDRANRECRLLAPNDIEHRGGLKAVMQNELALRDDGSTDMAHQASNM